VMVVIKPSFDARACAVRRAKSAKLIGRLPVTLWTSLLGGHPTRFRASQLDAVSCCSGRWVQPSPSEAAI
jgi:hypothetical protein